MIGSYPCQQKIYEGDSGWHWQTHQLMRWDASLRERKSWHSPARIWNHPGLFISRLIDILFVLSIRFLWNTEVSFFNGHFSTHATSYSLLCSVSHSVNLLLSVSHFPSSAYLPPPPPLCFCVPLLDIKDNWFVWPASLNKLIWTSIVPHSGLAHNTY
jgi:hypothetical protein